MDEPVPFAGVINLLRAIAEETSVEFSIKNQPSIHRIRLTLQGSATFDYRVTLGRAGFTWDDACKGWTRLISKADEKVVYAMLDTTDRPGEEDD